MKKIFANVKTFFTMFKQLMSILEKKQKRQCIWLLVGVFVGATMETLGIGAVVPFILVLLSPDTMMENETVKLIADLFGISSYLHLLILTAILIVAVYIIKNTILLLVHYFQGKYHNEIEKYLMNKQYRMFMLKPYSYYLNVNSSEVIRGISSDISQVAQVIDGFVGLISELFTILMIGGFIVFMDPMIAFGLIGTVLVVALVIILIFKKKTSFLGTECRDVFYQRSKITLESVNGYKEISVLQKRKYFINKFMGVSQKASKLNTQYLFIMKIPSRVIETVFIMSLLGIACLKIGLGGDNGEFVSLIGVMAVAAMRLLPSISSLSGYMNTLIYNRVGLDATYKNINETGNVDDDYLPLLENGDEYEQSPDFNKIVIDNVSFAYEGTTNKILDEVNLEIPRNISIAFVGESGAGKSTLLDVVLGLLIPNSGHIRLDETNISDIPYAWANIVGYVPQNVFLTDDSIRRNIAFGIEDDKIDDRKIWEVLRKAQLEDFVRELPEGLDTECGERGIRFSGGQRQRVAIARALYHNPEILVLDEATSALDNETEKDIMSAIDGLHGKMTIIIVAHRLTTIENCDSVYEVREGKLVHRK